MHFHDAFDLAHDFHVHSDELSNLCGQINGLLDPSENKETLSGTESLGQINVTQQLADQQHCKAGAVGVKTMSRSFIAPIVVFSPSLTDVLLGRGRKVREHPANQLLRDIVSRFRPKYDNSTREGKTDISKSIVQVMKANSSPPSRFLRFNKLTGTWVEVDDEIARLKVSHVFRDCKRTKHASNTTYLGRVDVKTAQALPLHSVSVTDAVRRPIDCSGRRHSVSEFEVLPSSCNGITVGFPMDSVETQKPAFSAQADDLAMPCPQGMEFLSLCCFHDHRESSDVGQRNIHESQTRLENQIIGQTITAFPATKYALSPSTMSSYILSGTQNCAMTTNSDTRNALEGSYFKQMQTEQQLPVEGAAGPSGHFSPLMLNCLASERREIAISDPFESQRIDGLYDTDFADLSNDAIDQLLSEYQEKGF